MQFPVPDGDVLIHAGDFTMSGTPEQVKAAGNWLATLPHSRKIVVAGNHDLLFEQEPEQALELIGHGKNGVTYLQEQLVMLDWCSIYGAPWSCLYRTLPGFPPRTKSRPWAFGLPDFGSKPNWDKVPFNLDILITHGPPLRILDLPPNNYPLGDPQLRDCVQEKEPRVHVFGHIHHSHGTAKIGKTLFVNAALCDEGYSHSQAPVVLDLRPEKVMELRS